MLVPGGHLEGCALFEREGGNHGVVADAVKLLALLPVRGIVFAWRASPAVWMEDLVRGRESRPRYGGSFRTQREALTRKQFIAGELAARRVPELAAFDEPVTAPTFAEAAKRRRTSSRSRTQVR